MMCPSRRGYVAAAVTGDFGVVRYEDDRAALGVELLEEHQHFEAGAGVEVASPLLTVGECWQKLTC